MYKHVKDTARQQRVFLPSILHVYYDSATDGLFVTGQDCRLFTRQELASFIADLNAAYNGMSDEDIVEQNHKQDVRDFEHATRTFAVDHPAYVYLMRRADGQVKIGIAQNPYTRVTEVEATVKQTIELIAFWKTNQPRGDEVAWHDRYWRKHTDGEWFVMESTDIEDVLAFARLLNTHGRPDIQEITEL